MKFYTAVLTAIAVAVASAATLSDVLNGYAAVKSDVEGLDSSINAYTSSQGLSGALAIQTAYGTLDSDFKKAISDTNSLSALSDSDSSTVASTINNLAPTFVKAANDLDAKRGEFVALSAGGVLKSDISSLQTDFTDFQNAVNSKLNAAGKSAIAGSISSVNSALSKLASDVSGY